MSDYSRQPVPQIAVMSIRTLDHNGESDHQSENAARLIRSYTAKQGQYLPGSRIPIVDEAHLRAHRPDRVLILPWNLQDEVVAQLDYVREWGALFAVAVPALKTL